MGGFGFRTLGIKYWAYPLSGEDAKFAGLPEHGLTKPLQSLLGGGAALSVRSIAALCITYAYAPKYIPSNTSKCFSNYA